MASSPGFYLGYQLAPLYTDDYYRLVIAEYALLKGRTSRIFKRLFEKDKTAIYMSGGIETRKGQSVLKMFVRANKKYVQNGLSQAIRNRSR